MSHPALAILLKNHFVLREVLLLQYVELLHVSVNSQAP